MSGNSYTGYKARLTAPLRGLASKDEKVRAKVEADRTERVRESRARISEGVATPPPKRDERRVYDAGLVRSRITRPSKEARRLHVVLVDNSGSNRTIAEHLKASSGYLLSVLGAIDPDSEIAMIYFSDHSDGPRLMQEVDYVRPGPEGDKVLHSSLAHVVAANGGDEPEAIECALWRACELDFGDIQDRHLYLVTDVVAHGMGIRGDDGCPEGRTWQESVERVGQTFRSFQVVGCGVDEHAAKLQAKFIRDPKRLGYDLIDLSSIRSHQHRTGITGNALLFLIARLQGVQSVEAFLMTLYEKWLDEPIFGANTELGAREAISRFTKYVEADPARIEAMRAKIFT